VVLVGKPLAALRLEADEDCPLLPAVPLLIVEVRVVVPLVPGPVGPVELPVPGVPAQRLLERWASHDQRGRALSSRLYISTAVSASIFDSSDLRAASLFSSSAMRSLVSDQICIESSRS